MRLLLDRFACEIGTILLVHDENRCLRALDFEDFESRMHRLLRLHYGEVALLDGAAPSAITRSLHAYFAGAHDALATIPTATGGTPFQRSVWSALRRIPAGETISYATLAARIGKPGAYRAVGMANGANPIAIVVPCHRVIGADKRLAGFGGGLHRKQWLLAHEGAQVKEDVHACDDTTTDPVLGDAGHFGDDTLR